MGLADQVGAVLIAEWAAEQVVGQVVVHVAEQGLADLLLPYFKYTTKQQPTKQNPLYNKQLILLSKQLHQQYTI